MPPERPLSASALTTYARCPLKFRFRYVDGLFWSQLWSLPPGDRAAVERGDNFHLMARRFYSGLDPARLADPLEQRELDHWMNLLQGFLGRTLDRTFHPELELRLNRSGLRLQAKFDLLAVEPDGRAVIYDWKTTRQMPRKAQLLQSMQTRVYRFMLCAAGGAYSPRGRFLPEEVGMIYWNPIHPTRWDRLSYSREQFELDERFLAEVAALIARTPADGFRPTADKKTCLHCEYRILCHGVRAEEDEAPPDGSDDDLAWVDLLEEDPPGIG